MSDEITFSCLSCGQHIVCDASESGRAMLCPSCGANLTVPHKMDEMRAPEPVSGEVPTLRVYRTSGLAVASLVSSLSSPILCVGWIPGIICGHLARAAIRRNQTLSGKNLATAGLIISYATAIVTVGLAVLFLGATARVNEAFRGAHELLATNQPTYTPTSQIQTQTQSNATDQVQSTGPGWTMDVKDAQIPSDPVIGEIHGANFDCKRVLYRNGNLKFLSADGGNFLMIHGVGASIENDSLEFQTASGDDAPKVEISWNDDQGQNETETFPNGYVMELKFGAAKKRKIQGQIYLCLPDDAKSYIAGTFTVVLPKPKPSPKVAQ